MSRNGKARKDLFSRGHKFCAYCGIELALKLGQRNTLSVDHVKPRSNGGETHPANIISGCIPCNNRKGSILLIPVFSTRNGRPI